MKHYRQSLAPLIGLNAQILIVGTLPGPLSLRQQAYYAHPRNVFWKIMAELLGIDRAASYAARAAALKKAHIGLWDVCAIADRKSALDADIDSMSVRANDFKSLLARYRSIRAIYFNGLKSQELYQRWVQPGLDEDQRALAKAALPSTSPAHTTVPFASKVDQWRVILSNEGHAA